VLEDLRSPHTERVEKLGAARRQLQTAIWLRFRGGDPIAIHGLCAAAYAIVEQLNAAAGGQAMLKGSSANWASCYRRRSKTYRAHQRAAKFSEACSGA
jgi:hypothetical protein